MLFGLRQGRFDGLLIAMEGIVALQELDGSL
jgi:hypothetical protein